MAFFSSRERHTRWPRDWSSDVCSSDLTLGELMLEKLGERMSALAALEVAATLDRGNLKRQEQLADRKSVVQGKSAARGGGGGKGGTLKKRQFTIFAGRR